MQSLKIIFITLTVLSTGIGNAQSDVLDYFDLRSIRKVDSILVETGRTKREMLLVYNDSGQLKKTLHYDTLRGDLHSRYNYFYNNEKFLERIVLESSIRRTDFNTGKVSRTPLQTFQTSIFKYHNDTLTSKIYIGDVLGMSSDTVISYYKYYRDSIVITYSNDIFSKTVQCMNPNGSMAVVSHFQKENRMAGNTAYVYQKSQLTALEINTILNEDGELYKNKITHIIRFWYDKRKRLIQYNDGKNHHLTYYPK